MPQRIPGPKVTALSASSTLQTPLSTKCQTSLYKAICSLLQINPRASF